MTNSRLWAQQEKQEMKGILHVYWDNIVNSYAHDRDKKIKTFEDYAIHTLYKVDRIKREQIEDLFRRVLVRDSSLKFDEFFAVTHTFGPEIISTLNQVEKLVKLEEKNYTSHPHCLRQNEIKSIKTYMQDRNMSACVSLRSNDSDSLTTIDSSDQINPPAFAMHSVGKVFTGMLALMMVNKGIIPEEALTKPLSETETFKDFIASFNPPLSKKIITHLQDNKITLNQMMLHQAGLGDYLEKYTNDLDQCIKDGKSVPILRQPEDFLRYSDDKTYEPGVNRYSNFGILLVGLAIKHAYEKQYGPHEYDEILRRYVIDDAKMSCFASVRPEKGKYNSKDPAAAYIAGSPAGGYWTAAEDLAKFGKWIYETCKADANLKQLIVRYGKEFYPDPNRDCIEHGGAIESASAFLLVSLKTGAVFAALSDQPGMAHTLVGKVYKNILCTESPPQLRSSTAFLANRGVATLTPPLLSESNYPLEKQNNMSVTTRMDESQKEPMQAMRDENTCTSNFPKH
jgi:hypothetical protein